MKTLANVLTILAALGIGYVGISYLLFPESSRPRARRRADPPAGLRVLSGRESRLPA